MTTRKWQAQLRNWIGNRQHGLLCIGARRNGRGEWIPPGELPREVVEYLGLQRTRGNVGSWIVKDVHSAKQIEDCKITRNGMGLRVSFEVYEPPGNRNPNRRRTMNQYTQEWIDEACRDGERIHAQRITAGICWLLRNHRRPAKGTYFVGDATEYYRWWPFEPRSPDDEINILANQELRNWLPTEEDYSAELRRPCRTAKEAYLLAARVMGKSAVVAFLEGKD